MDDDGGCWVCLWRRVLMDMMIMTDASSYEGGNTNINSQLLGVARTHVLQFANAYVAFMAQSGEGLGHEEMAAVTSSHHAV